MYGQRTLPQSASYELLSNMVATQIIVWEIAIGWRNATPPYDLKLAGEGALLLTQAESRIPEILGIDGILKKGTSAQASYVGGRFYECGNFNLDYRVTVDGLQEVKVGYSYADKAYFSSWYLMIDEPESAREWNYTTKDGTELLLVKDSGLCHYDGRVSG